ncbi:MAG: fructosamine kinase family protein, partial [Spirochaetales bacterium]|nr:fructosamine kinase family protein [Spirochaetales bacterium]
LEYQIRLNASQLDQTVSRQFLHFLDLLEAYLPEPEYPSLLHGDLWSGNVLAGPDGRAWILDPAAYYGHPEVDLAMTELFGSSPNSFYSGYNEVSPISSDYAERRDIYNLYHLLNHLHMFGSSYLMSIKAILERFVP